MLMFQSVRNYFSGIYVNVTECQQLLEWYLCQCYRALETIGVVSMLMFQSVRNYWSGIMLMLQSVTNYWSGIYVNVTECQQLLEWYLC